MSFDDDVAEKGLPFFPDNDARAAFQLSPTHVTATSNFETARAIAGTLTCSWKSIQSTGLGSRSPDPLRPLVRSTAAVYQIIWQRLAELNVLLGSDVRVQTLVGSAVILRVDVSCGEISIPIDARTGGRTRQTRNAPPAHLCPLDRTWSGSLRTDREFNR